MYCSCDFEVLLVLFTHLHEDIVVVNILRKTIEVGDVVYRQKQGKPGQHNRKTLEPIKCQQLPSSPTRVPQTRQPHRYPFATRSSIYSASKNFSHLVEHQ